MEETWELIEQRRDGLWYSLTRSGEPGAYRAYWLFTRGNPSRTLRVRSVREGDPPLSGTRFPQHRENIGTIREESSMPRNDPYNAGQALGKALAIVFLVQVNPGVGDVFNLGWTFAKLSGFVAADDAKEFTEGFAAGLQSVSGPKALATPGE